MINSKKVSALVASSVLSIGMFTPIADASSTVYGQPEKVRIQLASVETAYKKEDLIQKFRQLFPNQFEFLTASDFQMSSAHIFPDDETIRYDLQFTKVLNGKRLYGYVGFIGEELEVEYFSYQPANIADALFPAKVTKEEAGKVAEGFMKKFLDGKDYQLESDTSNYFSNQLLTEPIRYSFTFTRTKNQVPIADQMIEVYVLGNGEIGGFYKTQQNQGSSTFADVSKVKANEEMLKKVKDHLSVDLNYQINYNYETGDRNVQLVYQPTNRLQGVHALSGDWLTQNGYTANFPAKKKIEKLTAKPLSPRQEGVTVAEAKKIAEQLLAVTSDKVKLTIESIQETQNYNGQDVISVEYMYHYANGGHGSNLEINKQTGEVVQYYNFEEELLREMEKNATTENSLTEQEALKKAIAYAKKWAPSYLHNYGMPIEEASFDEQTGTYQFSFPRLVNGIVVIGDQISIGVGADGSLNSLNVEYQEIESWPSSEKVISDEQAKTLLKDALSLKLMYMNPTQNEKGNRYDLVYVPVFKGDMYSYLDANTGEWNNLFDAEQSIAITHPWAEAELNYLLNAKVLDVKDVEKFNADASVSKGEALKVLVNSLTYFHHGDYFFGQEEPTQTFDNIGVKHPLYSVVEHAVEAGIINPDKKFDADSSITREELAVWYVRVLGLEQAAKDSSMYKLSFDDTEKIETDKKGYVAVANSMGLLKTEKNLFNPKQEVSYAELAVSTIRLAHAMVDLGRDLH
ncbi:YcdB/YcdC domain-containing protein [Sporosarcina newyorkensis]|uniref:YcdB/YcdC domain-containing protein n=1 Tax=Sporosarcina newyorkensis TaxID=759851 RepID=UPI00031D9D60|nr:YcdB/YcdC domain-containing protein [Sporosarcina newyorkensis]